MLKFVRNRKKIRLLAEIGAVKQKCMKNIVCIGSSTHLVPVDMLIQHLVQRSICNDWSKTPSVRVLLFGHKLNFDGRQIGPEVVYGESYGAV